MATKGWLQDRSACSVHHDRADLEPLEDGSLMRDEKGDLKTVSLRL